MFTTHDGGAALKTTCASSRRGIDMTTYCKVCRLCRTEMPGKNSVALFSLAGEQQRLSTRISELLDVSVAKDDGLPGHICKKCKHRLEYLEKAAEDLVDFRDQAQAYQRLLLPQVRGPLKRTKESSGTFVSPDTARVRPVAKRSVTASRMLDFGPGSSHQPEREFKLTASVHVQTSNVYIHPVRSREPCCSVTSRTTTTCTTLARTTAIQHYGRNLGATPTATICGITTAPSQAQVGVK